MNFKKYILFGVAAMGMGLTSCIGDLDLKPNDPNLVNPSDPNFADNSLAMCYTGIAVSGYNGSGSSFIDIEGPMPVRRHICAYCSPSTSFLPTNSCGFGPMPVL